MTLSTKPYRGARDFYPKDKRLQNYIFNIWRQTVKSYGYEEYDAPIIEPIEIYQAKTGQEIVNEQTYRFSDRGHREVVIRPEMTPSVSRLVAAKRQELIYPLRWFSIPNLWRYERPQKGRLREHWQLNVDIFGVNDVTAELEMINLVNDIFKSFGAITDMYEIRINHRGLIDYVLNNQIKLSKDSTAKITRLIDKMLKMDKSDFITSLDECLSDSEKESNKAEAVLEYLEKIELNKFSDDIKKQSCYKELNFILSALNDTGIKNVKYDPSVIRGFDYYSGLVFEVYDSNIENTRSMMGGGRYDGLVGLFGVDPIPTVGFGWGDVTLINFLDAHHLVPKLQSETEAYIVLIGDVFNKSQEVLNKLRDCGLNLAVDLSQRKLGDQLKNGSKKDIKYAIIIGQDEINSGIFKLKDLSSFKEESLNLDDIIKKLVKKRSK